MKSNIKLLKARLIADKKADKKVILSALMIQKKILTNLRYFFENIQYYFH